VLMKISSRNAKRKKTWK